MKDDQRWDRLADAVKRGRIQAGFRTLEAWADKLGVSSKTLSRLEKGRSVSPATQIAIEGALGWPAGKSDEILRGEAGESKPSPYSEEHERRADKELEVLGAKLGLDEEGVEDFKEFYRLTRARQDRRTRRRTPVD